MVVKSGMCAHFSERKLVTVFLKKKQALTKLHHKLKQDSGSLGQSFQLRIKERQLKDAQHLVSINNDNHDGRLASSHIELNAHQGLTNGCILRRVNQLKWACVVVWHYEPYESNKYAIST